MTKATVISLPQPDDLDDLGMMSECLSLAAEIRGFIESGVLSLEDLLQWSQFTFDSLRVGLACMPPDRARAQADRISPKVMELSELIESNRARAKAMRPRRRAGGCQ